MINGTLDNDELLCYNFNKCMSLPPKNTLNLWSTTANEGIHLPPKDVIMLDSQEEDAYIWTMRNNDLTCIVYDENMNVSL